MTLSLRPIVESDAEACIAIYLDAIHNGTAPHYTEAEREAWAPRTATYDDRDWATRLKSGPGYLALDQGDPVGFVVMTDEGYLDLFFVRPSARRHGTAGALYDRLLASAGEIGLTRLTTHASHLARRFLEPRGWTTISNETVERNGVLLERFEMTLPLKPTAH